MKDKMIALVTGGTSGIGLETARALSEKGCKVYTVSRHPKKLDFAEALAADVTDESAVRQTVEHILDFEGGIDLLVNCAGFGISGAAEFTGSDASHRQTEVNLFGADNVTRAVLPSMRARGRGTIVFVSSVAGALAIPFQAWYSVSKAAILAYSDALRNEVRPYGIRVTCVLPGDIQTGFTAARQKSAEGDAAYSGRISRSVARMEKDEMNGMTSQSAGRRISGIALKKRPAPRYAIGFVYKLFLQLARLLPNRFVSFMLYQMYAK